jgi:hypothetical protein
VGKREVGPGASAHHVSPAFHLYSMRIRSI